MRLTDFNTSEVTDYQDQDEDQSLEPVIVKAKNAWNTTKSICGGVLWY
jgi:hypothetical protein